MGDELVIWWLVMSLNGLQMATVEPFHSDEACQLAGRTAQIGSFECVRVPVQPGWYPEREST